MKFSLLPLAICLVLLTLCSFLPPAAGQEPVAEKKLYRSTGSEATLTGTIAFHGKVPKRRMIDPAAEPVCKKLAANLRTESAIVNQGKLANAFVYVKSGDAIDLYSFEAPTSPALLSHKGCRYVPHVLGVRVGQILLISNDDPTRNNTHPTPRYNAEWNQSQERGAARIAKSFERPEIIPFKNNWHPWEKAYVGVFSHPFFAISDKRGQYRIEGLPHGRYSVVAWHESFGEQTVDVTISPNELRNIDFAFGPPSAQNVPGKAGH